MNRDIHWLLSVGKFIDTQNLLALVIITLSICPHHNHLYAIYLLDIGYHRKTMLLKGIVRLATPKSEDVFLY